MGFSWTPHHNLMTAVNHFCTSMLAVREYCSLQQTQRQWKDVHRMPVPSSRRPGKGKWTRPTLLLFLCQAVALVAGPWLGGHGACGGAGQTRQVRLYKLNGTWGKTHTHKASYRTVVSHWVYSYRTVATHGVYSYRTVSHWMFSHRTVVSLWAYSYRTVASHRAYSHRTASHVVLSYRQGVTLSV